MSVRHELVGFSVSLLVGMVLSSIVMAVNLVLELPHELLADSRAPVDVHAIALGAFAFATVCAVTRAISGRARIRASRAS